MSSQVQSVAFYARVSSDRQAKAQTIASQKADLQNRIAQDGHVCSDALSFIDDGCSGSTLLRPALERLRDAAAQGLFDRLYVHSPDRLARRHALQALLLEELKRNGIEVVFLNRALGSSPEDELLVQVQGVIAEYERAKIQERSRRGKRHAAQRGVLSVFSTAPYGYQYVPKSPTTPARFEIVAAEAAVVQSIFDWVAYEHCSMRQVCRHLLQRGIRTRTGRTVWDPATIGGILRNPAYIGQAAYGKTRVGERQPRLRPQRGRPEVPRRPGVSYPRPAEEWISVAVPTLVATEVFHTAAEQIRDNRRRCRARQHGAGHLLQGLLVCQLCGYACYGQSAKVAPGRPTYGYYRCIGTDGRRADGQRLCHLPTAPLTKLDDAVWADVRTLLGNPSRIQAEYQRRLKDRSGPSPRAQSLQTRRQRAQCGLARLIDAYTEGLLEKTEFEPRLKAAKQRLRELDAETKLLTERETLDQQLQKVIHRLEEFAQQVQERLETADKNLRRELIRALVKRVELGDQETRIVYRIDLRPFEPGPERGHLRHCVWRESAALQNMP